MMNHFLVSLIENLYEPKLELNGSMTLWKKSKRRIIYW
jgi:hypothetical protein